jgi:ferric-dicitrate binding protein FerR (iron transport regulator)
VVDCAIAREAMLGRERGAELDRAVEEHLQSCATCTADAARLDTLDEAMEGLAQDVAAPPPFEIVAGQAWAAARGRRRARFLRRTLPVTVAFAGVVAGTVLATRLFHQQEGRVAVEGEVLDASRGISEAALADGARVTIVSGRAVIEASNRTSAIVRLDAGTAFVSVPHLAPGRSFMVRTDEVEARVHGTRFEVGRGSQGTRVSVADGAVEIRPRDRPGEAFLLTRGESRLIEGLAQRRVRARAGALAALDRRDDSGAQDEIRAWLASDPPAEEAAEAHALLAWKMSRDGDRSGALASYRRALALLPSGRAPLWADNACAQLALLEEGESPEAGRAGWRRYLDRFPGGVHAATARSRIAGDGRRERR